MLCTSDKLVFPGGKITADVVPDPDDVFCASHREPRPQKASRYERQHQVCKFYNYNLHIAVALMWILDLQNAGPDRIADLLVDMLPYRLRENPFDENEQEILHSAFERRYSCAA